MGHNLIASVIGSAADPTYTIDTYASGQGGPAVAKYSDGTAATPQRYAYTLVSLKTKPQRLDVRTLGTAALLTSFTPTGTNHTFRTWTFEHGASAGAGCTGCHGSLDTHAATWKAIATSNGWCFRCHYGQGGAASGLIDPTQWRRIAPAHSAADNGPGARPLCSWARIRPLRGCTVTRAGPRSETGRLERRSAGESGP